MRSPDGMGTPIAPFRRVCGGICPLTTRSPVTRGRRMSAKSLLQRRLQQLTPESFNLRARARRRTRKRPALQRTTVSNGSAPVRDFRMQPFGRELVAVVGRHGRTTAIAYFDLLDGIGEGQVPRWTGHSPRKRPQAPLGRQRPVGPKRNSRSIGPERCLALAVARRPKPPPRSLALSAVPLKAAGGGDIWCAPERLQGVRDREYEGWRRPAPNV